MIFQSVGCPKSYGVFSARCPATSVLGLAARPEKEWTLLGLVCTSSSELLVERISPFNPCWTSLRFGLRSSAAARALAARGGARSPVGVNEATERWRGVKAWPHPPFLSGGQRPHVARPHHRWDSKARMASLGDNADSSSPAPPCAGTEAGGGSGGWRDSGGGVLLKARPLSGRALLWRASLG